MARDVVDMTPIESRDELVAWFAEGAKPKAQFRIGTEHEKFPFTADTHEPVPYEGRRSIRALLDGMQHLLGWEPIMDGPNIIGLLDVTGGGAISLEPGGQFELSGAPVETVHQTCSELNAHLAQCAKSREPLGIGFLGLGMSPKWTRAQTPVMPKSRYKIMTAYMPKVGALGLDMMYRTCTVQTNLDFSSEADMVKKLRVSLALQPVATALFANSPFTEGKPNGFLSFRSEVWRDTDPDRAGMLPFAFEHGMGFERYVDYALDVPMYFVKREDDYIDVSGPSFRDLLAGKLPGHGNCAPRFGLGQPCLDDLSGGAAEALPRNARRRCRPVAAAARAVGVLGRPSVRRCERSTPRGISSRTGPRKSARSCATTCRVQVFKATIRGAHMLDLAQECLRLARGGPEAARRISTATAATRRAISAAAGIRRARRHAGRRIAREISRTVGRVGRAGVYEYALLSEWPKARPRPSR